MRHYNQIYEIFNFFLFYFPFSSSPTTLIFFEAAKLIAVVENIPQIVFPTRLKLSLMDKVFSKHKFSRIARAKIYKFLSYMICSGSATNGIFNPVPIHTKDIIKPILGNSYKKYLAILEAEGIISINTFYQKPVGKEKGITREYQINCNLVDEFFEILDVKVKNRKKFSPSADTKVRHSIKCLKSLKIDLDKCKDRLIEYVSTDEYIDNPKIKIGDPVNRDFFERITIYCKFSRKYILLENISKDQLFRDFGNGERVLIQNDRTFYFLSLERFKFVRKCNVVYGHIYTILSFKHRKFSAKIGRYLRLHSTFSSLPSIFLDFLFYKGVNFKEIDFCNSQFQFLTYALTNTDQQNKLSQFAKFTGSDFSDESSQLFFNLSRRGELYEYVGKVLSIERNQAKQMFIEAVFSGKVNKDIEKLFPSIVRFLQAFKKKYGYKELSRDLQRIESTILIHVVYAELVKEGFISLTKHDAFFAPDNDNFDSFLSKFKELVKGAFGTTRTISIKINNNKVILN